MIATVFVLLLVLSGCPSLPDDQQADIPLSRAYYSSSTAVCGLLRTRDLQTVLGYRYSAGTGEFNPDFLTLPGISTCGYEKDGFGNHPKVYLGVVYAYSDQVFRDQARALRAGQGGGIGVTVRGLGQKAFWWPEATQMYAFAKGKMLALQYQPDVMETERDILKRGRRLLQIAIGRLR